MKMLLDIGNSMTKICLNKGISIKNIKKIENKKIKDYEKNLKNILVNFKKNKIEKIFISSVYSRALTGYNRKANYHSGNWARGRGQ